MNDMPTNDPLTNPENTLLKEAMELSPSAEKWRIDRDIDNTKEWWIGTFGWDSKGRECMIIATREGPFDRDSARSDAEFVVWCRNNWEAILRALAS